MKIPRYAPLLLCLCIGQALADTPINLQHAATPTARISISNVAGTVNLLPDANNAGTSVTTSGTNAYAVRVQNGGRFNATGATVHAMGNGTAAILFDAPQVLAAAPVVGATPGLPALPPTTPLQDPTTPPPPPAITTPDPVPPPATAIDAALPPLGVGSAVGAPAAGGSSRKRRHAGA